jgi:hypothetical protein
MTKHRTITAFVVIALLAAATTAAGMRSHIPNAAKTDFASSTTLGQKPTLETKKPVRYEAIISNWKRYRSTTNERTEYTARW